MAPLDDENGPKTITVSREALRAELLALELRLTEKLVAKGEFTTVEGRVTGIEKDFRDLQRHALIDGGPVSESVRVLDDRVEKLERGEFTDAQVQKILAMIALAFQQRSKQGWSARERGMGVILFAVSLATIALNTILAYHGWGH